MAMSEAESINATATAEESPVVDVESAARYLSVSLPRMKPNHEKKLAEAVSIYLSGYEKAEMEQPVMVYQAIAGLPSGTYFVRTRNDLGYVDQLYDALFVNRTKDLGNALFFVDSKFVDGAVNGTAATTRGTAVVSGFFDKYVVDGLVNLVGGINMMLNRIATSFQTGLVQRYALAAVFGIVVIVLIYYNDLFRF